jgi:hypothetical protein
MVLSKDEQKEIKGGDAPGGCLSDYTYDCSNDDACCSKNCETNGTGTGTLCMP